MPLMFRLGDVSDDALVYGHSAFDNGKRGTVQRGAPLRRNDSPFHVRAAAPSGVARASWGNPLILIRSRTGSSRLLSCS